MEEPCLNHRGFLNMPPQQVLIPRQFFGVKSLPSNKIVLTTEVKTSQMFMLRFISDMMHAEMLGSRWKAGAAPQL